jgi:hypothetical protein
MERAYLTYRGTHRRVSEPTWLTEEHTATGEYLGLPGLQRNTQRSTLLEPTWLTEERTGGYLSLPGLQRNTEESI